MSKIKCRQSDKIWQKNRENLLIIDVQRRDTLPKDIVKKYYEGPWDGDFCKNRSQLLAVNYFHKKKKFGLQKKISDTAYIQGKQGGSDL